MRGRSVTLVALSALSILSLPACFADRDSSGGQVAALPMLGEAPHGERYRVEGGRPSEGDDVASSWCLELRWTGGPTAISSGLESEMHGMAGDSTCGPSPAPRVSGIASFYCDADALFIFGGARTSAGKLELVPKKAKRIRAHHAALPPASGFEGTSFVIAAPLPRSLPATLREVSSHRPVVRLPRYSRACAPPPGPPTGGNYGGFLTFPEP
jgi:hypothetical protein